MELHCELRVTARARASGELCSLLACGLSLEELRDVLGRVFLQVVPGAGAGALEVEVVPQGGAPRCEAFLLRRSLASADDEAEGLSRLQVLRDQVLSGDFDLAVAQANCFFSS
ncbi:unnamed protein product [Polarella glacialis]|uniref:Uncharacterized protein n=1 Tax=Polarella glacialis TaxID=89957 RepID=A0A813FQR5_POLGL|nr:unnamed protein product [Polarella glacialis]